MDPSKKLPPGGITTPGAAAPPPVVGTTPPAYGAEGTCAASAAAELGYAWPLMTTEPAGAELWTVAAACGGGAPP